MFVTYTEMVVICPCPVSFQMSTGTDAGGGTLHFDLSWGSSTGNKADLSSCGMGELVTYNPNDVPFPAPFPDVSPANPTPTPFNPTTGEATDDHYTPGTFRKPYFAKSMTATQVYRYWCPCVNGGAWTTIMGPLYITRSVSQNPDGTWKFTITKAQGSATINPLP
jgi:hypothetical protein